MPGCREIWACKRTEVNLLVLTPEELERLKREDTPFYNSLIYNSMTLKGEPIEEYPCIHECFCEAEKNLGARACRSALSSAYMAIFHSARAILFRDGIREKSHYCIGLYLQKYVVEGNLEEEWPMLFDRIRSVRDADQYSFQAMPSEE